MLSALSEWFLGASGLAPHGYCLLWDRALIWVYAVSDATIAVAYFSIPLSLAIFGKRRSDLVLRPMLWLFAAFILLCGTTHWLDLVTLWAPLYGLQGLVKAATAIASVATAIALWWALPYFLSLPSAEQLRHAHAALLASEERLAHAQKMEALGQLTGGIAHDFNNVLQVIVGSINTIERQLAVGSAHAIERPLAAMRKAANAASSLTNRMLAFSRRQTLLPRVIEPNKLVAGMEEMLRRTLGPHIGLDLRFESRHRRVSCDPSQLEIALLNLAINARDAMPQGGVLTIATADRTLTADPDLPPGDYVEIEVTDSGVGMSEEVLGRVFEPFFTTKPLGQGTGLGLSQVYGFVRQSGGHVRIDSAPGKGTSARIYLPGHARPLPQPVPEVPPTPQACESPCEAHGGKTLVVEDQDEVRAQIVAVLAEMGCDSIEAVDGAGGLKLLESDERSISSSAMWAFLA